MPAPGTVLAGKGRTPAPSTAFLLGHGPECETTSSGHLLRHTTSSPTRVTELREKRAGFDTQTPPEGCSQEHGTWATGWQQLLPPGPGVSFFGNFCLKGLPSQPQLPPPGEEGPSGCQQMLGELLCGWPLTLGPAWRTSDLDF